MKALYLLLAATISVFPTGQDATYGLNWHPRASDTLTYKMRLDIDSSPEKYTFTASIKNKVLKVKDNGDYDIESTTTNARVKHGTHDDAADEDDKPTVDTFNSQGEKIASSEEKDPAEEGNPALDALDWVTDELRPKAPVKVGDKWTALLQPSAKLKRDAGKVDYTLAGIEKQGAYQVLKVSFRFRQSEKDVPITVDGFIMLNQQDFSLVRIEAMIKGGNFSNDPDYPSGDTTFSLIRD